MKINKNRVKTTTMIGLTALAFTSCASSNKAQKDNVVVKPDNIQNMEDLDNSYLILSDEQLSAVNKGNTFALNLFRTQAGMDSKVVSPLSVAYLMGMLANGAEGNTQTEIMKTLGTKRCFVRNFERGLQGNYQYCFNSRQADNCKHCQLHRCKPANKHKG